MTIKKRVRKVKKYSTEDRTNFWRKAFLFSTIVPMIFGALLIIGPTVGIVIWPWQILIGVSSILAGFAASNAVQKQWNLAAGWVLMIPAAWLWAAGPAAWGRALAYLVGGAGLFFLALEFIRRFQQR